MYITNFTPEQLVYERRWRIWIVLIVDAIELFACFRRPETLAQTLFVIGAVYVMSTEQTKKPCGARHSGPFVV